MKLKKPNFYDGFIIIKVIYRVSGPRVGTKVEPNLDPFTYWGLNKDPNSIFKLQVIEEPKTHLHP